MPEKHYKLFGITIWTIEVTESPQDESDDEEVTEKDISSTTAYAGPEMPAFGFTPWTPEPWSDDWED